MADDHPLGTPLTLRSGLVLPNRIAKAAMTEDLADRRRNDPGERHERLYARWSRGGAGLLLTGNVMVDRRFLERAGNVVIDRHTDRAAFARFAAAAKVGGAKALVQINHPGRQTNVFMSRRPVAPSPVRVKVLGSFAKPRALQDAEVERLVERFAEVAEMAQEAGFDGVQVHAAHGYLASQFLSPRTNLREDRWGGSLEGRARFLLACVRAIRARTGKGFTLSVKLNSADFQRGGFEEGESLEVARWLDAEGIDLLEISGGNYEAPELLGLQDARSERTKAREAYFLDYARTLRGKVEVPLMLTGGLRTRATMEALVRDRDVDLVGLARPLAIAPELPRGLLDGSVDASEAGEKRVGVKGLDALVGAGWYAMQIARLAEGMEPEPALRAWSAVVPSFGSEIGGMLARFGRRVPSSL
ncbi:MAG: NADH:flavin oxidoreductase/NADH oxidase family protein [Myxococcota bacterium]